MAEGDGGRSFYDDVVDELYGLTPDVFVRRRNELVKERRAKGERALAKRISLLRRPTQPAWAINQWVRRNPDESEQIARLSADLTAAQRRSAGDKLRALSRQRQELITVATDAVTQTAADLGVTLSDSAIREVAQTMRAAIADAEISDRLRRGNLVVAEEYSGFGPAGVFVVPDSQTDEDAQEDDDEESEGSEVSEVSGDESYDEEDVEDEGGEEEHDEDEAVEDEGDEDEEGEDEDEDDDHQSDLEDRLGEAEADERVAREHLAEVTSTVEATSTEVDELVDRARELRERLARCEEELRFARQRLSTAQHERTEAKAAVRRAVAVTNELRLELADL